MTIWDDIGRQWRRAAAAALALAVLAGCERALPPDPQVARFSPEGAHPARAAAGPGATRATLPGARASASGRPAISQKDAVASAAKPGAASARQLDIRASRWRGDFDQMVERRLIRVLVPYSRTLFFNENGRERGLAAELVRDFEDYLNRRHKTGNRPVTVLLIATSRDRLISGVVDGSGDIAVGNLTVTPERLQKVDFAGIDEQRSLAEIVVGGPRSPKIGALEDLAGKRIHVRRASSYYDSIAVLNKRFRREGRPRARVELVPDAVEDEDLMEMLADGLLNGLVVVDDWKAELWAPLLPELRLYKNVTLRTGGQRGWAIRRGSPKLAAAIDDFYQSFVKPKALNEFRLDQLQRRGRRLADPAGGASGKRFRRLFTLFETYGAKYHFDPLLLMAQGFQESRLEQSARSPAGAIGVMQVTPAAARDAGIRNIGQVEGNVHAAVRYLDILLTRYLTGTRFDDHERTLFAFAAYNAGPGRIEEMRKEAKRRGLDENRWFDNVELVTSEKIGREPVEYVRNIYKYYVSYKVAAVAEREARRARVQVEKAGG